MNVPPRPSVPKEPPLLIGVEALPQRMTVRAKTIDCCAPADFCTALSKPTPHRTKAAVRDVRRLDGSRLKIRVRTRDLSAARHRNNPPRMPSSVERQDEVDHRETRANEQRRASGFS